MKKSSIVILFLVCMGMIIPAVSAQEEFAESYYVNRSKACIHYFFSCFEKNPRDVEAIVAMLTEKDLEMIYPWGKIKSRDDARKWIAGIPDEFKDAHHINNIKVSKEEESKYKVIADIVWQNQGPEKEQFDSAHLIYEFELIDNNEQFLKIRKLHSRIAD